jgi:ribosomal protein S11
MAAEDAAQESCRARRSRTPEVEVRGLGASVELRALQAVDHHRIRDVTPIPQ